MTTKYVHSITIKYTKLPQIHKMVIKYTNIFLFNGLQKYPKYGILGMQIYHLANLQSCKYGCFLKKQSL
jgi:hypothetical protein